MTWAIVPLVTALVAVWVGRRQLAVLVFLAYLSIEGFLKLVSNYNPVVHVGADLVLLALTSWWVAAAIIERRRMTRLPFLWLILLHSTWVMLMLAHPLTAGLYVGLAALKIHLSMIPLYFIVSSLVKNREDAIRLATGIVAIACVPMAISLIQYALGPASVLDLSARYWQNISYFHEWRPFGMSATPGGTAAQAFVTVPIAAALAVTPDLSVRVKRIAKLGILLGVAAFLVAGGRQLFLGCALALLVMAAVALSRGRSRGIAALALVVVLGGGAYLGVRSVLEPLAMSAIARDSRAPDIWEQFSVLDRWRTLVDPEVYGSARLGAMDRVVSRFRRYPLGAGLGRTGSAGGVLREQMGSDPMQQSINREVGFSDSFFADMLAETGIPGTLMLTTLLIGFGLMSLRLARRSADPLTSGLGGAVAGLCFAIMVTSWGSQPLLSNPITAYFWLYGGLIAGLVVAERSAESAAESPAAAPESVAPLAALS